MNQLQRFYQWIATSPPLFKLRPPFATLEDVSVKPLNSSEQYNGNPRLGFYISTYALRLFLIQNDIRLLPKKFS